MNIYPVAAMVLMPIIVSILTLFCTAPLSRVLCRCTAVSLFCSASFIAYTIAHGQKTVAIVLGGWKLPLAIALYLDGLSALLLLITATISLCITFYSETYFGQKSQTGRLFFFWPLWFLTWAALNALFLSGDIFNCYVTIEIINLSGVALVALPRNKKSLNAALNYLAIAFLGSFSYLFGVALLYAKHGTLDMYLLADLAKIDGTFVTAGALILVGLMVKTALFPLHFWLPPAHAAAPSPVSALLSGLVVTASAYMILRLAFTLFAPLMETPIVYLLGVLGGLAVLWGSVQALLQDRVKMVVAYSTVAQIGYVFLALPVIKSNPELRAMVWYGILYFVLCHACSKAAAFLAAGSLISFAQHDRIDSLSGAAARQPMVFMAIGLAGVNLIGLPPSGAFIGKWLMLQAMISSGNWFSVLVLIAGSLLAAGYMLRILGPALKESNLSEHTHPAPLSLSLMPLLLALIPIFLGFFSKLPFDLLAVGSPFGVLP